MSHYCIACDDLAHGREPSRPHQGCAEIGKNGASPAPSASPATQRTIPEPQIHPQPPFPAVGKRAAPASPATEDEALVDAFDEAAVACQAAADLASATALSERKETARVSLLSHLTALRRRAEEAAEEFTRYRNEREPHYRKIAEDAQRETASLRAEVAALRQERDDARFDGANARAEVERLTAQAERDNATVRKLNAQRNALQTEAANSMAEVERLRERAHKADGMANEINILVGENRKLAAEVARAREEAFEEAARAVENFGDAAACDLAAELRALASPSPEKED